MTIKPSFAAGILTIAAIGSLSQTTPVQANIEEDINKRVCAIFTELVDIRALWHEGIGAAVTETLQDLNIEAHKECAEPTDAKAIKCCIGNVWRHSVEQGEFDGIPKSMPKTKATMENLARLLDDQKDAAQGFKRACKDLSARKCPPHHKCKFR